MIKRPPKPSPSHHCPKVILTDVRKIDAKFFRPYEGYSPEDREFFKRASQFKHFKRRIDLIVKKHEKGTLVFIPPHEYILFKALKLLVLNKMPTVRRGLVRRIHAYLHEKFGREGLEKIIKDYANYLKRFKNDDK